MAKKQVNYKQVIENHPFIVLGTVFICGFVFCFSILQFYYTDRIQDIKENYDFRLNEQVKDCNAQINLKILEVQNNEREKYYLRLDENSTNGKLLEKTLELIEKKGGKNDK